MFTGIITDIGTIRNAEDGGSRRLFIAATQDLSDVDLGASIACSGVCLTVVDKGDDWFAVDVSGETLSRTATNLWDEGARLNLERALRLGDELGGHIVTGHVDGVADVLAADPDGNSLRLTIRALRDLAPMIAPKGSITLDGVSLTVNSDAEAEKYFAALADGGEAKMPLSPTFFASKFGMVVDRFGVSWMVHKPNQA